MLYHSNSEKETEAIGASFAATLAPGTVCAFFGELGSGKTAFIRGMARGLGIDMPVSSPSFNIVNEYPGKIPLFHFDMYRLGSSDELFDIGWEDYLERNGVCAVEWSERVEDVFEPGMYYIVFTKTGETERNISIEVKK
jgi:tRNA threonylcarbamoyladenosine biosynthesis protein TsaE